VSDTVIRVENLGKKYIIGHQKQQPYTALRDVIADGVKSFSRKLLKPFGKKIYDRAYEEFWALKDVSFEIKQGEVVGIIGRNGAGKSTVLKILSRITEPTAGRIYIKGRVASLLEVGTGFHPELTGKENIYLNGAILGMSKTEIKQKFDEIVSFAEVEKFLDTPVKRYSSGMYVRLAFAVAAHLEADILLVDEVLAVGDTHFQKKCLGKMENVGKEGRTVLFVSHNMGIIENLCPRGICLKSGLVYHDGLVQVSIAHYLALFQEFQNYYPGIIYKNNKNDERDNFQIVEVALLDEKKQYKQTIKTWDYVVIRIKYYCPTYVQKASVVLEINTFYGTKIIQYSTQPLSGLQLSFIPGESYADCIIPRFPLTAGNYRISVGLAVPMMEWLCWEENIATLEIAENDVYKSGFPPNQQRTLVAVEHFWEVDSK
jgi:lipopolysaccharide transport system ATP-binding protein